MKSESRKSEREAALDILLNILEEGAFSGGTIDKELRRQSRTPESRAFITRLCEGTIERLITIDDVIDSCASVRCRKMKPVIRNILRESVYQMLFMDNVADAVAVDEAVTLAKKRGFAGLAKFVNGVLRTVGRKKESFSFYTGKEVEPGSGDSEKTEGEKTESASAEESKRKTESIFAEGSKGKTEKISHQECKKEAGAKSDGDNLKRTRETSVFYSVPPWLVRHMESVAGRDRAEAVFKDFLTVRPLQARVNLTNADKRNVVESLTAEGLQVLEHPYLDNVILLESASRLTRTEAFREGRIQVQDASSVLAVAAAGIHPGMRVLDVCAAPGGKSLYAADLLCSEKRSGSSTDDSSEEKREEKAAVRREANSLTEDVSPEKMSAQSSIVRSRDLTEAKVKKIRENAVRCHFDGLIRTEVADARVFDPALEGWADVVIADLPCSGLGVIAKKPDIKYRVKPEDLTSLAALQREILSVVWRYVKPGGVLIYSTCTVSPEENGQNVRWFLSQGYPMEADDMAPFLPERLAAELIKQQEKTGVQSQRKITELQLLPGEYETDGFFIARFRRSPKQEHEEKPRMSKPVHVLKDPAR